MKTARNDQIEGDGLAAQVTELAPQPAPELLKSHDRDGTRGYRRAMIPSTGSATWDAVGQIAIACLMLVSLVVMWRRR